MHARAYHERERLELSPIEVLDTRANIYSNTGVAGIGVLSIIIALAARSFAPQLTGIAGYIYCLIGVVEWRVGEYRGRGRAKLVDLTDSRAATFDFRHGLLSPRGAGHTGRWSAAATSVMLQRHCRGPVSELLADFEGPNRKS